MINSGYSTRFASVAASLLLLVPMALSAQTVQNVVPLKNWATPLYWQPNQTERQASGRSAAQIQFSANATSNTALTLVAITPCRLVDTRGTGGGFTGSSPFSGPGFSGAGILSFPIQASSQTNTTAPSPCGAIPSIAQAYSLNMTVVPHSGGQVNYLTMWPEGATQPVVATFNDPQGQIVANAAIVPAGTPSGGISVYSNGPAAADIVIDMNGYFAAPTDVGGNTAIGALTLLANTTGTGDTAIGFGAMAANSAGIDNTATGSGALLANTTGNTNTATGQAAMTNNTTGNSNTAVGAQALQGNTTGSNNAALGAGALDLNLTGSSNTAVGEGALSVNTLGSGNVALGAGAGSSVALGNYNIFVGNIGVGTDSRVIRIGTQGTQTVTSIAGIYGGSPAVSNLLVCVDATGTLGTTGCSSTPSSQRFKEQIADMGDASSKLLQLRPVTFLYKPEYDDGSHALQYGLIAEEVAKLYPDMVGYDKEGLPNSVKYQSLTPMLLNELQKQAQRQQAENRKLEDRIAALEALLSAQTPGQKSGQ